MSKLLLALLKLFPVKTALLTIMEWWKKYVDKSETQIDDEVWEILYKLINAWDGDIPPQTKIALARKLKR